MTEKISTVILKVDLNCRSCYKKISKTICKLQAREKIQTVAFDEKNSTVTISGPFDPKKLCKKLCCKACKVIKDIQIKENKEKEKEKPKDAKPAEPAKPKEDKPKEVKPDKPKEDKPKETKSAEPAKPKEDKPKETKPAEPAKPAKPKEDKPKETKPTETAKPKEAEPEKPKPKHKCEPVQLEPECQPIWPGRTCNCGCTSWFEGYYGACPWCGRGYGWSPVVVPQPVVVCGAPPACGGYKTCEFFYEEDPQSSCSIM